MATQWPLVIFTFFICLSSGLLFCLGCLTLKGKGRGIQLAAVVTSLAALVIGGFGSFLHLQHWERIFNGFGHVTSGITQELIGCGLLFVVVVAWLVVLHKKQDTGKGLAWVTIVVALVMVLAMAHSYFMGGRPGWGAGLFFFYLASAFMLGAVGVWAIACFKGDGESGAEGARLSVVGTIAQAVCELLYLAIITTARIDNVGYYADPTRMTTHPLHIDNLAAYAVAGDGALMFWLSIVFVVVAVLAALKGKKAPGSKGLMCLTAVGAVVTSFTFRVLIYQIGVNLMLIY